MEIYTIGFASHPAETFFRSLTSNRIEVLVDVRLRNQSQLSGFAKQRDLTYFLSTIGNISYAHEPLLAPTAELLDAYRSKKMAWEAYSDMYLELLLGRRIE